MIKREQPLCKWIAKKIDKEVDKPGRRGLVIVSLNWFERYLLNRDWDRNQNQLMADLNDFLRSSLVEHVAIWKTDNGQTLKLVKFGARRHIEL